MKKKNWWQKSFAAFLMRLAVGFFLSGGLSMVAEQAFGAGGWLSGSLIQFALLLFALAFYFACVESLVLHRFTLELWLSAAMAITTFLIVVAMMGFVM